MPAHPDFVASFGTALRGGDLPAGLVARHPDEVGRRFAVYRNNVAVSLSAALASRFPVIRQLVGEAFFAALARLHAEQDRPKSPVLAEWGAGFAAFLEGFPPLEAYPAEQRTRIETELNELRARLRTTPASGPSRA